MNVRGLTSRLLFMTLMISSLAYSQVSKIDFRRNQERELNRSETKTIVEKNSILQKRVEKRKELEKGIIELDAMESSLNPDDYLVGPGDILSINILSSLPEYFETIISPEATVDLPGFATLDVEGLTLSQAKKKIQSSITGVYIQSEVFVSIISLRLIKVFLTGEVLAPGAVATKSMDRVIDLILKLGGVTQLGLFNEIHIKSNDGSEKIINGYQYTLEGDNSFNPLLKNGDVIFVPKADIITQTVTIQGASLKQGLYPFISGETVYDFLNRYSDFGEKTNIDIITISRRIENDSENILINLKNRSSDKSDIKLAAGDILNISFLPEVYIYGEVKYPGSYPYVSGYSMLDYIGLAGGNTLDGSHKAYIMRHENKIKSLDTKIKRGDIIIVPRSYKSVIVGRLSILQVSYTFISTLISIFVLREALN